MLMSQKKKKDSDSDSRDDYPYGEYPEIPTLKREISILYSIHRRLQLEETWIRRFERERGQKLTIGAGRTKEIILAEKKAVWNAAWHVSTMLMDLKG